MSFMRGVTVDFNQRNQKEGERIDNFVSELKYFSLTCKFGILSDSLIRD